jgi:hypothetical protein
VRSVVSFIPGSSDRTRFGPRVRHTGHSGVRDHSKQTVPIALLDPLIVVSFSVQRLPTLPSTCAPVDARAFTVAPVVACQSEIASLLAST